MANTEAEDLCKKGNEAFKEKKWEDAIKFYNKAITLEPNCAKYYSNRSGAWSSKGNHDSALADANRCLEKDSKFVKGYSRKGKALFDLGRWDDAEEAFNEGLALEPDNAGFKQSLQDIKSRRERARSQPSSAGGGGFGAGFLQQLMDKFKQGGRMQMYLLLFGGYYLYNAISGRGGSKQADNSSVGHDEVPSYDDEAPQDSSETVLQLRDVRRAFTEVDGTWISYLQYGRQSSKQILLLHSAASSAETTFSATLPQLVEAAQTEKIQFLAPDRPCHGFSMCPAEDQSGSDRAKWLETFLSRVALKSSKLFVAASGREAAQEALSLAARLDGISELMLVNPTRQAPSWRKLSSAEDVIGWLDLEKQKIASAPAAADAARWALSHAASPQLSTKALDAEGLHPDSKVSVFYSGEETQDLALHDSLTSQRIQVTTHRGPSSDVVKVISQEMRSIFGVTSTQADL